MKYFTNGGFGLVCGLVMSLFTLRVVPITQQLQTLFFTLLMLLALCYAFSYFPGVSWVMSSAQRALLPKGAKGKLERFAWINGLAAGAVILIAHALFQRAGP